MKDPFKLLGVSLDATHDEINTAYRKLSRTCHPDVNPNNPNAQEDFCALTAARDLLLDDAKRSAYIRNQAATAMMTPPQLVKRILVSLEQVYNGETIQYTDETVGVIPLCLKTIPLGQTIGIPNSPLNILLELKQDYPGCTFSISGSNIVLEFLINLGNILSGYTIAFNHPIGKMVIRDTWRETQMGVKTMYYPNFGLPIHGTTGFGQLVVKVKVNLDGVDRIPPTIITSLRTACPYLFVPSPITPDKSYYDITQTGVKNPKMDSQFETAEKVRRAVNNGNFKFGVEMTGCAQQ